MSSVSVIIPAFNAAHFLTESIQSVLDQTHQDFEVIVVDDGSTDNTREVVEKLGDSRIKYIYQENQGMAGARNTGIRASNGEYMAFLDADDLFLPYKLSAQIALLKQNPQIGFTAGGHVIIDENGRTLGTRKPWQHFPQIDMSMLLYQCPFVPTAVLVCSDWVERVGMFDENLIGVADWDLWLRLAKAECRMAWCKKTVCMYRLHGENTSRNAKLMGGEALQVLDKLYASSDLPEEASAVKNCVYAEKYLGRAGQFYVAGEFSDAAKDVWKAVELDPQLLAGRPAKAVEIVTSWAFYPRVENQDRFLADVQANFPPIVPNLKRHFSKVTAQTRMARVFKGYSKGHLKEIRKPLLSGIFHDPSWLHNRGVWSIAVEAFLGQRVANRVRRYQQNRQQARGH